MHWPSTVNLKLSSEQLNLEQLRELSKQRFSNRDATKFYRFSQFYRELKITKG